MMKSRIVFLFLILVIASKLYATMLFKIDDSSFKFNQCPTHETNNPLDFALIGSGYFIVSNGKRDNEYLFTRHGELHLDTDGYLRTNDNLYLMRMLNRANPEHLAKIKISNKDIAPKATRKIDIELNLPADAKKNDYYETSLMIYDALAAKHNIKVKYVKNEKFSWDVYISDTNMALSKGLLVFKTDGTLEKQEGLNNIQWQTDNGIHELTVNFNSTTQYASNFKVFLQRFDGHGIGVLSGLNVNMNGEIFLIFDNGLSKMIKGRLAIAKFTNPGSLDLVFGQLYKASERSGMPMIHWSNSDYNVLNGHLEDGNCIL